MIFATIEYRIANALSRTDQEIARWEFIAGATQAELIDELGESGPVQQNVRVCYVVWINGFALANQIIAANDEARATSLPC